MENIKFSQLPLSARIAVGVSLFVIWWLFEQYAINPYLHPYFPGYVVGHPCGWDVGVGLIISGWVVIKSRGTPHYSTC